MTVSPEMPAESANMTRYITPVIVYFQLCFQEPLNISHQSVSNGGGLQHCHQIDQPVGEQIKPAQLVHKPLAPIPNITPTYFRA